jgi:hypothetical protein
VGQITFLFGSLLSQDMTFEGMLSLDLPCSGKGEPLFGTGISLHLRHLLIRWLLMVYKG